MKQTPDTDGRIIVSNKIPLFEWERAIKNCAKLPGKIPLNKYTEMALKRENDWQENSSPFMILTGVSKMKELSDDMLKLSKDLEEHKAYINDLIESNKAKDVELLAYKKVSGKVGG